MLKIPIYAFANFLPPSLYSSSVNEILISLHRYRHRCAITAATFPRRLMAQTLPLTPAALSAHIRRELKGPPQGQTHGQGESAASLPNALDMVHVPVLDALQEALDDERLLATQQVAEVLWRRLLVETAASLHRAYN